MGMTPTPSTPAVSRRVGMGRFSLPVTGTVDAAPRLQQYDHPFLVLLGVSTDVAPGLPLDALDTDPTMCTFLLDLLSGAAAAPGEPVYGAHRPCHAPAVEGVAVSIFDDVAAVVLLGAADPGDLVAAKAGDGEMAGILEVSSGLGVPGGFDDATYPRAALCAIPRDQGRERTAHYRQFIEHLQGIAYQFRPGGSPAFMEGLVEEITGYTADQFLEGEISWIDLVYPGDLRRVMEEDRRYTTMPGYRLDIEYRIVRADDGIRWVRDIGRAGWGEAPSGDALVSGIVYDVTASRTARAALAEERERYERLTSYAGAVILKVEVESGRVVYINPAAKRVFGYTAEDFARQPLLLVRGLHPRSRDEALALMRSVRAGDVGTRQTTLSWITREGGEAFLEITVIPLVEESGEIRYVEAIGRDITREREHARRLQYISMHDRLTGLSNRTHFEDALWRLEEGRGEGYPVTLLVADVDGLKLVNDTLGHREGDRLLRHAASMLTGALRRSDILARIGGDEFAAILPQTPASRHPEIAARIKDALGRHNEHHPDLPLSLSVGLAVAADQKTRLEDAFRRADDLMYRDKLHHRASSKSSLVDALLAAIEAREYPGEVPPETLAALCRAIGEELGLSVYELGDVETLARVHDIGKIGVPDEVLFKRGPLDERERALVAQHPEIGFRIASAAPDLKNIAELILSHQERWDGSGYPMGLRGEEIPIQCRILAVAHQYLSALSCPDAGGAHEPQGARRERARRHVHAGRKGAFDPAVLDALERVLVQRSFLA